MRRCWPGKTPLALAARGVPPEDIERAKGFLFSPGISVLRDAAVARRAVDVHAMHDPTEGGLATGLLEMAEAADAGLLVDLAAVPVLPECRRICDALGLDPMGLIASGALLAAVSPADAPTLIDALAQEGIPARDIGRFTDRADGLKAHHPHRHNRPPSIPPRRAGPPLLHLSPSAAYVRA